LKQREVLEAFAEACETNDFARISQVWSHYSYDLEGAREVFVVDETKHDEPLLPTDVSFKGKCFLTSLLKSRQLGSIQNPSSPRRFNYCWYALADTNFVSYCNAAYSGKSLGPLADAFYAAGDYLMTKRGNLRALCFLVENFDRRFLTQVKESMKAFAAFKFADPEAFRRNRVIHPTVPEKRLEEMATSVLAVLETPDFKTIYGPMKQYHLLSCIALTRIAAIDFSSRKGKPAKQKFLKLLEYFDKEVTMLPQIELLVAWRYYELKSQEPFFNTIQRNAGDLLGSIRSMAWDLAHWRNALMLATATGHLGINANVPIPYFLTFDQAFAGLLRHLQLKGVIFLGSGTRYIAIPDNQNLQSFSDVVEEAEHLLTPAAVTDRQKRRPADHALASHFELLARAAQEELVAIINGSGPS
jgi:hypothetical protein